VKDGIAEAALIHQRNPESSLLRLDCGSQARGTRTYDQEINGGRVRTLHPVGRLLAHASRLGHSAENWYAEAGET